MRSKSKKRAKNIDDATKKQIIQILYEWGQDKLTWRLLTEEIMLRTFQRYTRQALDRHEIIREAFDLAISRLRGASFLHKKRASRTSQALLDQNAKLKTENSRLEHEINRLRELHIILVNNVINRGLDESFQYKPLPKVNRGQTRKR